MRKLLTLSIALAAIVGLSAISFGRSMILNDPLPVSGGAAWTPASVTTAFWYDASNAGSITQSGGTVSQWNDLSGNARHLTQATTALQPTYTASALNSKPGIHFINNNSSTTNSLMQTATFTAGQPLTVVVVFKNGAGGPNTSPGGMAGFGLLVYLEPSQTAPNF